MNEPEGWIGDEEFPDPGSSDEERECCEGAIRSLQEAESYLLKGPDLENRVMAAYCCGDALISLGHFSELRTQRILALPEESSASDFWDVQLLRVVAKGLNVTTVMDTPYDPEWKEDYRGRPEFLGPVPSRSKAADSS